MSQEAASEQALPDQQLPQPVPGQQAPGAPKGLLQQMEELMAALSADLSQLDADLQSSVDRHEPEPPAEDGSSARRPAGGYDGRHDGGAGAR
ncbi:hypothetical protein [Streptomyces sp. NPDC093105]|uniref:hypothetical protein n=1 Tax=Streptomyces sp. NPDC093105 TaxID=3366029 RepID=UPI0037FFBB05